MDIEREDMQQTEGMGVPPDQQGRDAGQPGGDEGRRDVTGRSGVYPVSDMGGASGDAPVVGEMEFGQGERGPAGYYDSGESELTPLDLDAEAADQPGEAGQTGQ
jgi:hypothetical protein